MAPADLWQFDPLRDERWTPFLRQHPHASVFHSPPWLNALRLTYGYQPVAFTLSPPDAALNNALLFCRVDSWLTGRRMVSLPFSDHCQPLLDDEKSWGLLLSLFRDKMLSQRWKYIEIRPLRIPGPGAAHGPSNPTGPRFKFHKLDLRPDLDTLFQAFHKSCVQKKIRRAERERLACEEGRSEALLNKFYTLLVQTRRRHGLPPQPFSWFTNLAECLRDSLTVRLASVDGRPVAAIVTLAYKDTLVYKYGCSDERFHNLGGMPFLFWVTIQKAKQAGFRELDLGRSDMDNEGLAAFKSRLGAASGELAYYRYPAGSMAGPAQKWGGRVARYVFSQLPDSLLIRSGNLLYKHLG